MRFTSDLARMHDDLCAGYVRRGRGWLIFAAICTLILLGVLYVAPAWCRDLGQWEGSDPTVRAWYQSLMQPDAPATSCCGEADAYWADEIHVRSGKTFAVITDDREDAPLGRPHIAIGTEFEVPNHKLKYDQGNPTGHSVVFLSRNGWVYCFVMGGGT